jgi:teichuronic acid biosynthesis glycosyltransferase TuaG
VSTTSHRTAPSSVDDAEVLAPLREPLVDVCIPTVGGCRYLTEAVESVLAQSLPDWRLVVSENGPGLPSVRETLEPYLLDTRISHVITGSRIDRGAHFTRLIRAGSAPYVCILHDDDRWRPAFLFERVEFLRSSRQCGFVFSDYSVIDGDGRPIARARLGLTPGVQTSSRIFPQLYRRMLVASPTVMVRRDAYETIRAEFKDIQFSDHEMWIRLAARFDAGYLADADAEYRFHTDQESSKRTREGEESLRVLDAVEDLAIPRHVRMAGRAEAHVWCAFDSIEEGDRRQSLEHLAVAVRTDVLSLVRPTIASRMLAALAALLTGARGGRALAHLRDHRWQTRRQRGVSFSSSVEPLGSSDMPEVQSAGP